MEGQRELVFHDTVGLPDEQLEKGRKKAVRQKDVILAMFKYARGCWFTPWEIASKYPEASGGHSIMITSVRRSITDLTREGKLIKGDYSMQTEEMHGVNNNRWKYNTEYLPPLNPQR